MRVDPNFMQGGYHKQGSSGKQVVREDLMSTHAQAYGELFASRDRRRQVSSSQLRSFYGDVKALEQKLERKIEQGKNKREAFEEMYYLVKMLKSKAS